MVMPTENGFCWLKVSWGGRAALPGISAGLRRVSTRGLCSHSKTNSSSTAGWFLSQPLCLPAILYCYEVISFPTSLSLQAALLPLLLCVQLELCTASWTGRATRPALEAGRALHPLCLHHVISTSITIGWLRHYLPQTHDWVSLSTTVLLEGRRKITITNLHRWDTPPHHPSTHTLSICEIQIQSNVLDLKEVKFATRTIVFPTSENQAVICLFSLSPPSICFKLLGRTGRIKSFAEALPWTPRDSNPAVPRTRWEKQDSQQRKQSMNIPVWTTAGCAPAALSVRRGVFPTFSWHRTSVTIRYVPYRQCYNFRTARCHFWMHWESLPHLTSERFLSWMLQGMDFERHAAFEGLSTGFTCKWHVLCVCCNTMVHWRGSVKGKPFFNQRVPPIPSRTVITTYR